VLEAMFSNSRMKPKYFKEFQKSRIVIFYKKIWNYCRNGQRTGRCNLMSTSAKTWNTIRSLKYNGKYTAGNSTRREWYGSVYYNILYYSPLLYTVRWLIAWSYWSIEHFHPTNIILLELTADNISSYVCCASACVDVFWWAVERSSILTSIRDVCRCLLSSDCPSVWCSRWYRY